MTAASDDQASTWRRLEALFSLGGDPYLAGAAALLSRAPDEVTQDERDLVERVFARVAVARGEELLGKSVQVLRRAADLFHEIGSALAAEALLTDVRNAVLAASLRENQRSSDQLRAITADGFELCVRALAAAGAPDVTIHECGASAFGEQPWSGDE